MMSWIIWCIFSLFGVTPSLAKFSDLLDMHYPIVFEGPKLAETDRSSHFGYTTILNTNKLFNTSWVLVGAPRANYTNAESKLISFEPGMVYRCYLTVSETEYPCKAVLINDKVKNQKLYDTALTLDKSWLGGSMSIDRTQSMIVVCAPRFRIRMRNGFLVPGICIATRSDMENNEAPEIDVFAPIKFYETSTKDQISHRNINHNTLGQAGFSASFAEDKFSNDPDIHLGIGAPGVDNSRGTTVLYGIFGKHGANQKKRDVEKSLVYMSLRSSIDSMSINEIRGGEYLGYSIVGGNFFGDQVIWAAGAPSGNNYGGMVLVYSFHRGESSKPTVRQFIHSGSDLPLYSFFGGTLAVGDLSGDNCSDLLVGAPNLAEPKVFIYLGSRVGKHLTAPAGDVKYLEGGSDLGHMSQFGIAITTADLDLDGYDDVIVGAPGAPGGGAVAVYKGALGGPQSRKPHQLIFASTYRQYLPANVPFKGFGMGLAQPFDVNDDGFPDVAIGSPLSDQVVILRGIPRVDLEQTLDLVRPNHLQTETKNFTIKSCLTITAIALFHTDIVYVDRELIVDFIGGRTSLRTLPRNKFPITIGKINCEHFDVIIRQDVTNNLEPIEIYMKTTISDLNKETKIYYRSVYYVTTGADSFLSLQPRMEDVAPKTLRLPFATNCGGDQICQSSLYVTAAFPNLKNGSFILGSSDSIDLQISVSNVGEPAYLVRALVTLPRGTSLVGLPSSCFYESSRNMPQCDISKRMENNTISKPLTLKIDIKGFSGLGEVQFIIEVAKNGELLNLDMNPHIAVVDFVYEADVLLTGTSLEKTTAAIPENQNETETKTFVHFYELNKIGQSDIELVNLTILIPYKYQNDSNEVNFIGRLEMSGMQGRQPFTCHHIEEKDAEDKNMTDFQWPGTRQQNSSSYKMKKGILEDNRLQLEVDAVSPKSENLQYSKRTKKNVNIEEYMQESNYPFNRTVLLRCGDSSGVLCHTILCMVGPFRRHRNDASLQLTMDLNISSIKGSLMGSKDIIVLQTLGWAARMSVPGVVDAPAHAPTVVTSAHVLLPPGAEPVAPWVIPLAVAIGLIIFTAVTMGLLKAGFFERTKKLELEKMKEAEQANQNPDAVVTEESMADSLDDLQEMDLAEDAKTQ